MFSASQLHPRTYTMERSHRRPSRLLQSMLLSIILALAIPADALYFYMEGTTPKCFYEELPKDTLVVGMLESTMTSAYALC